MKHLTYDEARQLYEKMELSRSITIKMIDEAWTRMKLEADNIETLLKQHREPIEMTIEEILEREG